MPSEPVAPVEPVDPDERRELDWCRGNRAAWTSMLAKCISELGWQDPTAARYAWIIEREQIQAKLRELLGT